MTALDDHPIVERPFIVDRPDDLRWTRATDVLVVGMGGAGIAAALEAHAAGASVLAIDRFGGGGATAYSGGIFYAAGTRYQAKPVSATMPRRCSNISSWSSGNAVEIRDAEKILRGEQWRYRMASTSWCAIRRRSLSREDSLSARRQISILFRQRECCRISRESQTRPARGTVR